MAIDVLGIELAIAFCVLVPFLILGGLAVRRWLVRGHVWYRVFLQTGRIKGGHQKPDKKGDLHMLNGTYHTNAESMRLVHPWLLPEAPGFEYYQGNGWPMVPKSKAIYKMVVNPKYKEPASGAANGGTETVPKMVPQFSHYEAYLSPQVLPAEAQAVIDHTKIFADMYGGRERLILILVILTVLVLVISIVALARGR